ncbi:tyrosine recombinase [Candidatus Anaplasma sp. TIGMIC]|uniref:tyrosine recombinase n=1 Tax=Candidatus Anaplasma sp. TIGMIC TaxID=3020713 RepID=UPI00232BD24C|nr:tyrosine recombinase [Candidatus Anaplasma sp. TIGMIC]MDB1135345.1 tyrosine recombinase [Candidatus Anaplasma sp. TIGMIC]
MAVFVNDDNCVDAFIEFLSSGRGISENTCCSYRYDLIDLRKFLRKRAVSIVDVSYDDLRSYVRSMSKKKFSAATLARRVSAIKGMYKFLYNDRITSRDPSLNLDVCKSGRSLPKVIGEPDINRLFEEAQGDLTSEGKRTHAIISILYSSGMRVSELTQLGFYEVHAMLREQQSDIGHIVIKGKGNRDRLILLNQAAMESIRAYLEVRECFITKAKAESKWLFPGAKFDQCISRQRVGQILKDLALAAGVDPAKISPHKFRHSFATHLLNNGSNVVFIQKMLGHVNLSTTQVYTYVASEKLRETLRRFHPLSDTKDDRQS